MAKLLKLRRGTTTQHASFTGAEGEVTVDITKDTAVVHDGSQAGGRPLAREDMSNVSSASIAGRLGTDSIAVTKIAAGTLPSDVKVEHGNIVDGTVRNAELANDCVNGNKIADDAVGNEHLAANCVNTVQIANDQVTYAKMGNIGTNSIMGRISSGDGDPQSLSAANVRTIINVENGATADQSAAEIRTLVESASDSNVFTDADHSKLNGIESGATGDQTAAEILTAIKTVDGGGSGLDADTLDGIDSSSFLRSDTDDTVSDYQNKITFTSNSAINTASGNHASLECFNGTVGNDAFMSFHVGGDFALYFGLDGGINDIAVGGWSMGNNSYRVWHQGNDGSGSGLDSDTVDGYQASQFLRSDTSDTIAGNLTVGAGTNSYIHMVDTDHGQRSIHCNSNNIGFLTQTSAWGAYCDDSGNWTAVGNVTAYSDARLKTDIHTINDALSICGKLRGVSYKWIKDGKPSIGVIAQEIEEVLPEVVLTQQVLDSTGEKEVKSVDYGKIVGVLINAINELKAEVDELKGGK